MKYSDGFFRTLMLVLATWLVVGSITAAPRAVRAAVLFEGWSKVLISSEHVGYMIQRYEFDEKKKEFKTAHFLKVGQGTGGIQESLVARSDSSFKPVSYQYTGFANNTPVAIDATFKGDKMTALVTEGKTKKTVSNTLPKGTFLSAFLGYVMLQGKEGLKKGVKYDYQGILEESATLSKGEAFISEEETVSGIPAFRILNSINGSKFISLATHKAEILGTTSPSNGVQTVLVSTMEEAVGGFGVNSANLAALFGSVPAGKENEVHRRGLKSPPKKDAAKTEAPKVGAPKAAAPAIAAPAVAPPRTAPVTPPAVQAPAGPAAENKGQ